MASFISERIGIHVVIVHALQSFGVPPNGREFAEILWVDRLQRGRSKVFQAQVIMVVLAIFLATILFFLLMYPEMASIQVTTRFSFALSYFKIDYFGKL